MTVILLGFLTGAALIVAIGAQNAYVLRQGLRREHVGVVIAICALSDVVLIASGVAGVGVVAGLHPRIIDLLTWVGAAYLVWFGLRSLWSARSSGALHAGEPRAAGSVALTAVALTWLNPHVYLDTVLMLGSVANQYGPQGRWLFALGAVTASGVWFTGLGLGARALAPLLSHPRTWQVIDVLVGLTMLAIAALLVLG
ncbi:LysE/ArgO family amino acid transporter [Mobilicoccus sp.]|uniref:LysE/ArgO family amino acid transporter n=1 Tax=Mobilicoccus sp. TaxID=2034349 RepID=UPI0028A686FD|nr:LysE/ArgO family amino acid transporter [Mobilicoccus sp.]